MFKDYEIIGSSSSGNAVYIEDMLFDVGLPFSRLGKRLYKTKYIFITHTHADHLNMATAMRIQKEFPRIKWIGNYHVAGKIAINHIVGDETVVELDDRTIESFECIHDVPTHGFVITMGGKRMIYATDTNNLRNAPPGPYDALFLESNHDENKLETIKEVSIKTYGYDAYASSLRHLSTQKSKAFYYINRGSKDAPWVELHKSSRFY